ncbi:MAG: YaaR family protein [Spirochaetota bacterium]
MERISGEGFFSYRREVGGKKDSRRLRKPAAAKSFFSELRESERVSSGFSVTDETSEAATAELLDAVFEAGDRLKRHADSEALRNYRERVGRFLKAVVSRGMDVEERTSGSNILRRKRYTLVQVIDTKLEQLAAGMISSQREQLDVLARVDEINGLLVDLSH